MQETGLVMEQGRDVREGGGAGGDADGYGPLWVGRERERDDSKRLDADG